jgi:phosphatidylserine/phosphatidylglycerophosphate/cardiolipin synthase-like enzyme
VSLLRRAVLVAAAVTLVATGCGGSNGSPRADAKAADQAGQQIEAVQQANLPKPAAAQKSTVLSGCNKKPPYEVCFNSPGRAHGGDAAVIRRMTSLFASAGAGDSIRVAMFRWDIPQAADALIAAQQRGAHVEIVADDDVGTNPVGKNLLQTIEAGEPGSNVTICNGACLPWRGHGPAPPSQNVVHLKLILMDVGGVQSVVTSSNNLEKRQYVQYNSLLKIDDPGLYAWGLQYFKRLQAQSLTVDGNTWTDKQKAYHGTPPAMVYPRKGDILEKTLKGVTCAPGMNTVDIMIAVVQRYDIRAQIGRLFLDGCHLRIVTTRDLIENWLQKPFKLPDGATVDLPDQNVRTIITHDKVYAIHAKFRGKERYLVVTGTSNSTCGGLLYNDEMMVRLKGQWLFDRYDDHVSDAFHHAHQANVSAVPVQAHCS